MRVLPAGGTVRLALFTDLFRHYPLEEAISLVAASGFRSIELNACEYWDPHVDFSRPDFPSQVDRLARAMERYGVRLAAVATSSDLAALDPEERRRSVDYCLRAMGSLHGLGCRMLTAVASGNNLLPLPPQRAALEASLREIGERAAGMGWEVAVEIYPGHCLEDTTSALELLHRIGLPNVGYLFCVSHIAAVGEDVVLSYERTRVRILHVHLSDTPTATADHQHLVPGYGEADCGGILSRLAEDGYRRVVSVQIYSHSDRPVESAIESLEAVHRLLQQTPPHLRVTLGSAHNEPLIRQRKRQRKIG